MKYCCPMRARFIVQIVAEDRSQKQPKDLVDFIVDWEHSPPVIAIKYCPFCGKQIDHDHEPLRRLK